jgi:hypothetical protein
MRQGKPEAFPSGCTSNADGSARRVNRFPVRRAEGKGVKIMNNRITGLFGTAGAAAGALAVGTEIAEAQDLGASIAGAVTGSVSSIATNSGGNVGGGLITESNSFDLGEQTGTAIADSSGGDSNLSFVS